MERASEAEHCRVLWSKYVSNVSCASKQTQRATEWPVKNATVCDQKRSQFRLIVYPQLLDFFMVLKYFQGLGHQSFIFQSCHKIVKIISFHSLSLRISWVETLVIIMIQVRTRPSRLIGCDVWIVERMRYRLTNRPTDQPTDRRIQPVIEVLCRT